MAGDTYIVISEVDWYEPSETINYAHVVEAHSLDDAVDMVLKHDYGKEMRIVGVAGPPLRATDPANGMCLKEVEREEIVTWTYSNTGRWRKV